MITSETCAYHLIYTTLGVVGILHSAPPLSYPEPDTGIWSIDLILYWIKRKSWTPLAPMGDIGVSSTVSAKDTMGVMWAQEELRAVNLERNAGILDGDIITVSAMKKEDLPDYEIFSLQWDIIRMASLCGGAEPEEDEGEDDDDDGQETNGAI